MKNDSGEGLALAGVALAGVDRTPTRDKAGEIQRTVGGLAVKEWNRGELMRQCLFIEFGISELYESREDQQCPKLEWLDVDIEGHKWMIAECGRPAKTRKIRFSDGIHYICSYSCKKRCKESPVEKFFRETRGRIWKWRNGLIDDQLDRLEARQHQRPVSDLIITL